MTMMTTSFTEMTTSICKLLNHLIFLGKIKDCMKNIEEDCIKNIERSYGAFIGIGTYIAILVERRRKSQFVSSDSSSETVSEGEKSHYYSLLLLLKTLSSANTSLISSQCNKKIFKDVRITNNHVANAELRSPCALRNQTSRVITTRQTQNCEVPVR